VERSFPTILVQELSGNPNDLFRSIGGCGYSIFVGSCIISTYAVFERRGCA